MITTTRLTALVVVIIISTTRRAAAVIALTILRHRRTITGGPIAATTKVLVFDHAGRVLWPINKVNSIGNELQRTRLVEVSRFKDKREIIVPFDCLYTTRLAIVLTLFRASISVSLRLRALLIVALTSTSVATI